MQQANRKTYHRGNVRDDLVIAARDVLHNEGLAALSLRRVAREVGVAPSAVYNHFRNREALLAAVAADGYRQLSRLERDSYDGTQKSPEVLLALSRRYLRFASENPSLYRLMFSPEVVDYRTDPELAEAGESSFGLSVDWWYGQGAYAVTPRAREHPLALSVWAIMHGLAMQVIDGLVSINRNDSAALDRLAEQTMQTLIQGLEAPLSKKP